MKFPIQELTFKCCNCQEVSVAQLDFLPRELACPHCGTPIYSTQTLRGWIYAASNESMPGLFKVGITSRNVQERLRELSSSTGVPTPFVLECLVLSSQPEEDETRIQEQLVAHRVPGKEFFRVKRGKAIRVIVDVCGRGAEYSRPITQEQRPSRKNGKLICPKCHHAMQRLANKAGWLCKKCEFLTDNNGEPML